MPSELQAEVERLRAALGLPHKYTGDPTHALAECVGRAHELRQASRELMTCFLTHTPLFRGWDTVYSGSIDIDDYKRLEKVLK